MLRVPNLDGDARRVHEGLSWFGQKKALRPAGRGEYCISLHLSACIRVQVVRERTDPRSQREKVRVQRRLLEMLIFYGGMVTGFSSFVVRRPLCRAPYLPFYRVRGGRDAEGASEVKFCRSLRRLL
jgi:hypothetical protein